jgi:hypothetical protein
MPDFDKKRTKIRKTLGLILAGFIIISIILIGYNDLSLNDIPGFVIIAIVFFVLLVILGLVIPFKHHGALHSIFAAFIFSICWFFIEFLIFNLILSQALLIGVFAFCGFMLHLILDKDLKWI